MSLRCSGSAFITRANSVLEALNFSSTRIFWWNFLQVDFFLGSIGALRGWTGRLDKRQLLFLCRELWHCPQAPWYIQGAKSADTLQTLVGNVHHICFRGKALSEVSGKSGVSQTECMYPKLFKNIWMWLVQIHTWRNQAFKKQTRASLHKKNTLKCISPFHVDGGSYSSSTDCSVVPHFSERFEVTLLPLFPNSERGVDSSVS